MKKEVALVTGATSGIGLATALKLSSRGAIVGLLGRDRTRAEALAAKLEQNGGQGIVLIADVSEPRQVEGAVSSMIEQTGQLDTVVANAGVAFSATLAATREEDWARVMRINLDGTFFTAKFTMPHLLKSRGTFTAVASDGGIQGAMAYAAYCASKHGVVGFVRCLALDHGKDGVRCNMVAPGFVETPMAEALLAGASEAERDYYQKNVPMGRFARPEEVADAIVHLTSDQASYANGMVYSLDGGSTSGYYAAA